MPLLPILLLSQAVVVPTTSPLLPSNKWEVNYADDSCTLAREFGSAEESVLFGLTTTPFSSRYTVKLMSPGRLAGNRRKPVSIALDLQPAEVDQNWTIIAPQKGTRLLTFGVSVSQFSGASNSSILRVTEPDGTIVALQTERLRAGLKALSDCSQDLGATWGLDKAVMSAVAVPAKGIDEANWVTLDDYPVPSLAAGEEGQVTIFWKIGVDGRVTDCRTARSSGHPDLDAASCAAVTKRGRYEPAKDEQGRPVASYGSRKVVFSIPHV